MQRTVDSMIVLSRTNYGERDRVVNALGRTSGKITLFAKGVRSQKSKLAAGIELLCVSEVGYIDGKSDLKTLTSSRIVEHFGRLVSGVDMMHFAFDALKLTAKICEDGHGQEFFDPLAAFLRGLNDPEVNPAIASTWYGLRILDLMGTAPRIDVEGEGEHYRFNQDLQQFEASSSGQFTQNDIKLLRVLLSAPKPPIVRIAPRSEADLQQLVRLLLKTNL